MKQLLGLIVALGCLLAGAARAAEQPFPKPSPYAITWELKFEHSKPKRVVVRSDASSVPQAFWYMTYTVTNNTDREQLFLPVMEMVTKDGKVIRNDKSIPKPVFEAIKKIEGNKFLEPAFQIGGAIRLGEDEAKDGVAIWPEPETEMGAFSIYVQGLSGETAQVKGPDAKDQILRKTLQLNYLIRGDDVYPGENEVNENPQDWVMR